MLRDWLGFEFAGVKLMREAEHTAADGRRYLVIHGDEFDGVIRYAASSRIWATGPTTGRWC